MYVETGKDDADQVSLDFYLSDTQGSTTTLGAALRKWNVKVTQIACGSPYMYGLFLTKYFYHGNILGHPLTVFSITLA